jgi:hypothetical protein
MSKKYLNMSLDEAVNSNRVCRICEGNICGEALRLDTRAAGKYLHLFFHPNCLKHASTELT